MSMFKLHIYAVKIELEGSKQQLPWCEQQWHIPTSTTVKSDQCLYYPLIRKKNTSKNFATKIAIFFTHYFKHVWGVQKNRLRN